MTGPVPPPPSPPAPRAAKSPARPSVAGRSATPIGSTRAGKRCPTCGERFPIDYRVCPRDVVELEVEAEDERDPYLGTTLADTYRIVRRIGIGGMGAVYEAHHARLPGRRYAVKIMHDELARKPELVTRFRREAEVAGLAAHAHAVQIFDVGDTPDGIPFIVAELLEGEDLGQCLEREHRLSLADTVRIIRPLCAALSAAHAVGVVHRDLKPDNVFLVEADDDDAPPIPKLLDFGIARMTDPALGNRTRTGVVMGTPAYMAPEQARGAHVDQRCDVYAVGAILYRCLTGRPVFDDDDPAATLTAVLTREPDRPRAVMPELPAAVELVIERALARDPSERYPDMQTLDEALGELVEAPTTTNAPRATPTSSLAVVETTERKRRQVARARPSLVAATAIGFLLAAGVAVDLLGRLLAQRADDGVPSGTEGALVVVGVLAALATPTGLWIRFLRRRIWRNSLRAVGMARRATMVVTAAATAYAGLLLGARVLDLGLATTPSAAPGLLAAIVASSAAAVATAVAWIASRPLRHEHPQ